MKFRLLVLFLLCILFLISCSKLTGHVKDDTINKTETTDTDIINKLAPSDPKADTNKFSKDQETEEINAKAVIELSEKYKREIFSEGQLKVPEYIKNSEDMLCVAHILPNHA